LLAVFAVGTPARVARGQQMYYQDTGASRVVEHTDAEAATAWSEGRLEFDREPLRYVVETVNRYSGRDIALDRASAEQLYTGLVLKDQIDDWILGLERIFPVEIIEHGTHVCVRSRNVAVLRGNTSCGGAASP
jgi:transmembrane sensor